MEWLCRSGRRRDARMGAEAQAEQRPPVRRLELDRAAHQLGELARDREPEPAAGRDRTLDAIEAVEDVVGVLGRDPAALVLHLEPDGAVDAVTAEAHRRPG